MKKTKIEGNFEKKIRLILQEELLQISEKDIQTSWAMLERRIRVWEKTQQHIQPNHQRDTNNLGDNAGKSIMCSKK